MFIVFDKVSKAHNESSVFLQTTYWSLWLVANWLNWRTYAIGGFLANLKFQKQVMGGKMQILASRNVESSGTPTFLSDQSLME